MTKYPLVVLSFFVVVTPTFVSAQVVINEFLYDASGSDTGKEYVELYNVGAAPADLTKWKINDGSNHVFNVPPKNGGTGAILLPAGGYALLVDNAAVFIAAHANIQGTIIDTVLSLPNTGGIIALLNDSGATADSVSYTKDQGGNGDGNALQKHAGTWIAAAPTPDALNAESASKPHIVASAAAAASSATPPAARSPRPQNKTPVVDMADDVPAEMETAAAASALSGPPAQTGGTYWWLGALALAALAGGAVFAVRRTKAEEWDITEET